MLKKVSSNSKKGFTLVEVSVSVGIIVVLTSIAIVAGSSAKANARDNQRKTDIQLLQVKLEAYRGQYGVYPISLDGNEKSLVSSGIVSATVLDQLKDPSIKLLYTYIPLQFSGGTCGMSYYLYAILEKDDNGLRPAINTDLLKRCDNIALSVNPSDPKLYYVTSPK